ncbi:hypothetical protein [Streptomyces tagetis]|uniref:Cytochrome P450 n=1 Tax=Streptomyces tagetis TaxID=2820809 RepID=A0A940XDZ5_9ACTN|nr:hypothetical protein [Streptomyces sp. RG38]MBQ0826680.1 hypothetical protein [Streptomyces sp. RG38]
MKDVGPEAAPGHPFTAPAAPEPPTEWGELRRDCLVINTTKSSCEENESAHEAVADCMSRLVRTKWDAPGGDLISRLLLGSDSQGAPMPEEGLVATGQAPLPADHETTAGSIATMAAHLSADHARGELLLADRSQIRSAVEETLRFDRNGTFGSGRHSCLGRPLARTKFQAVLGVLLERLPTLGLPVNPGDFCRHDGMLTAPRRELPVTW